LTLRPRWPPCGRCGGDFRKQGQSPSFSSLIALVVTIIILVFVLGLLQYVLNLFPSPEPLGMFSEWSS
jgi:hypothetical protein